MLSYLYKNNLKIYDFNSKKPFPNHYKLSTLFCSLFFLGMYCYYIIPITISPMIGGVYCLAFLIYYINSLCMKNKYIQQHDIAHFILICNFGWFLLTDIYNY